MGICQGDVGYGVQQVISGLNNRLIADQTWNFGNSSLRLVNTHVEGWWGAWSCSTSLLIENGTLVHPVSLDNTNIMISNSQLQFVNAQAESNFTLINSVINPVTTNVMTVSGNAKLNLVNCPLIPNSAVNVIPNGTFSRS